MFLINSRTIFVTEIYECLTISNETNIDTPYTEAKELMLPNSLNKIKLSGLSLLS